MSGWRLGYVILPAELKTQALKVHAATVIFTPRISQVAGIAALQGEAEHLPEFQSILAARRALIYQRLDEMPEIFQYVKPEGTYYVFPRIVAEHENSRIFALRLLERAGVAVTPGCAFGPSGEGHVRIAYCVSDDVINQAFDRMEKLFASKGSDATMME